MHNSRAAQERNKSLERMARAAITQYNDDMAAGGEPLYPDWALELLGLIHDYDRVLDQLARQRLEMVSVVDFESCQRSTRVVQLKRVMS